MNQINMSKPKLKVNDADMGDYEYQYYETDIEDDNEGITEP